MTDKKERDQLSRLADAFVEDILETPDQEILDEFRALHGDPAAYAEQMKARFQKIRISANKSRLHAAKAAVAASTGSIPMPVIDIAEARKTLRHLLASPAARQLTLAARNERELSDDDVRGMLSALYELGLWSPESGEGGSS